jgi:hypothetical protein
VAACAGKGGYWMAIGQLGQTGKEVDLGCPIARFDLVSKIRVCLRKAPIEL